MRWLIAVLIAGAVLFPASKASLAQTRASSIKRPEIVVQKGHNAGMNGGVQVMAISPDGRLVASGGGAQDTTIRLWDTTTWLLVKVIPDAASVEGLAFHPEGRLLASSSMGSATLWDLLTGSQVSEWYLGTGSYRARTLGLGFAADGKQMGIRRISGKNNEEEIRVWDVKSGREVEGECSWCASLPVPTNEVVTRDGRWLARGRPERSTIEIQDVIGLNDQGIPRTGSLHRQAGGDVTYGESLAFSPDGRWLAIGGGVSYRNGDSAIRLWDLQTGELFHRVSFGVYGIPKISFSADGRRLAFVAHGTGPSISSIEVREAASADRVDSYRARIRTFALNPQGEWLVFNEEMSGNYRLQIWRFGTEGRPAEWVHSGLYSSVEFSPDGHWLIGGGGAIHVLDIWNASTRQLEKSLNKAVDGLAISPDGRLTAVANDEELAVIETGSWRELYSLPTRSLGMGTKAARVRYVLKFSSDGKVLAGLGPRDIKLLEASTGRLLRTITGHTDEVRDVAFSPDGRWMASISEDGSVRIWNPATGEEVALLAMMRGSSDWLVVTPDGLFDGSMAALRSLVGWRFAENQTAPLEIFFNEFYHPGLLADIFAGKRPKAPSDISQKDRRQPQLKLTLVNTQPNATLTTRNLGVKVDVSQAPAGAQDVRLFRNGSLVKVWRGDVLKGQGSATLEATIPIIAGENQLTAYAFNHDNIKSSDATLTITGGDNLKRKGTAYILAVGVNEYANTQYNLKYAVADAQDFAAELKLQQTKLNNYERVELISLNDKEATKANILKSFTDLSAKIQPEDALIIYFAGHGTAQQNRFYLIPTDLGYAGSRTKLDSVGLRNILAHSISDEELGRAVEGIDAGQLLLVIDACNSGQALEAEEKRRGPMNSKGLAQLAYEKGMYILTAAQSYQAAQEAARLGHGFLTFALVEEGLKTNAGDREPKDGQVLLREWLDFATDRVPQMQQEKLDEQQKQGRQLDRIKFAEADSGNERSIQRPRVFYRRETETYPLVVAKMGVATTSASLPESLGSHQGIEMVYIPPGSFMMGSNKREKPVHEVTISQDFYMGKYEVTQGQWQAVMGSNPSSFKDCGSNCPVENVTWNDAQDFINKLNHRNDGYTYRLPSEAEWEYACRAGTTGDYHAADVDDIGWYADNSGEKTQPVGGKQPNAFGLYDMSGNVWEWCQDWYVDSYDGAPTNGTARLSGGEMNERVLRGGSWHLDASQLRSGNRNRYRPDIRNDTLGFRVVAVVRTP